MYAQNISSDYERFLRRALGLEAEPLRESSNVFPADPNVGLIDVEYCEQQESVSAIKPVTISIR